MSKPEHYFSAQSPPLSDTEMEKGDLRGFYGEAPSDEGQTEKTNGQADKKGRICGLRRKVCFWVTGAIILVAILAIVLGAALGVALGSNSRSKSEPQVHHMAVLQEMYH